MIIDVTRLVDRTLQARLPTGVDRVGLEYVRYYGPRSDALVRVAGRWVFLDGADAQDLFAALLKPSARFSTLVRWLVGKAYCVHWQRPRKGTVLLNTGHSGLDSAQYQENVRKFDFRVVYFLHDLIPVSHPEYCRAGESSRHARRLSTMLESGVGIIVNSQDTAERLAEYAQNFYPRLPPCVVALLGPAKLSIPKLSRPMAEPYFVMLGTIEPRKNHLLILQLWRDLVREFGEQTPKLVVIGQRGWECEQVVDLLERCPAIHYAVIELPHCTDEELATWLHHAQALLFPAFVEGYGLPLIEALSQQCPVIASDLDVFRELAADIPEYLNPQDGLGWRQAVLDFTQGDSPRRIDQLRRMQSFTVPSWHAHFMRVDHLLKTVQGDGQGD